MAYFYHPQLIKKKFVKTDIKQLSPKKNNLEGLMKIEGIQAISVLGGQNCSPPPGVLELKGVSLLFFFFKYLLFTFFTLAMY